MRPKQAQQNAASSIEQLEDDGPEKALRETPIQPA
jgi:hypothetical protein